MLRYIRLLAATLWDVFLDLLATLLVDIASLFRRRKPLPRKDAAHIVDEYDIYDPEYNH